MNTDELIERQQQRLQLKITPKSNTPETPEDLVMGIIRDNSAAGLHRAFVLEALRFYSKIVADKEPMPLEEDTRIIPEKVWHDVALDVQQRINTFNEAQRS